MNATRVKTTALAGVTLALPLAVLMTFARDAHAQLALGTAFTYQGSLTDGGAPANGTFDFQFDLRDDPTAGGSLGVVAIEDVVVTQGVFTVSLDFGAQFDGDRRWLEIGVRPGADTGTHTTLLPRVEVAASPHALYSTRAGVAGDAELLDGMDSTDFPDGHSLDSSDGSPADALAVDAAGNVGIGMAPVVVAGGLTQLDEHTTGFSFPHAIAANGAFVYVVNRDSGFLQIFDVSDPSAITPRGGTSSGLSRPTDVAVSGNFAYVTDFTTDRIQVFDVSNPDAPTARGFGNVNNPEQVEISGTTAVVLSSSNLLRFSVANPDSVGLLSTSPLAAAPGRAMAINGSTTYVASGSFPNSGIEIFSGAFSAGSVGGPEYQSLTVGGSALYALSSSETLHVYEFNGIGVAFLTGVSLPGFGSPGSRTDMIVGGNSLYVGGSSGTAVVDVTAPSNPVLLSVAGGGSEFVARTGSTVATVDSAPARLRTFGPTNFTTRLAVGGHAIKSAGGTSWLAFSDARLKRDVAPLGTALATILGLNPVSFHFNEDYARMFGEAIERKLHYGFLAQEYREQFPEDVRPGPGGYLTLDASSLDPYLVRAIQELNGELRRLREENADLRDSRGEMLERLEKLESRVESK